MQLSGGYFWAFGMRKRLRLIWAFGLRGHRREGHAVHALLVWLHARKLDLVGRDDCEKILEGQVMRQNPSDPDISGGQWNTGSRQG